MRRIRSFVASFVRDLRLAFRRLKRRPVHAATVTVTVALGSAGVGVVLLLVNAIFLRPLPGVQNQESLVNLHAVSGAEGELHRFSHPEYRLLVEAGGPFAELAAFTDQGVSIRTGDRTEMGVAQLVSGNYFTALGTHPRLGRLLGPIDDRSDADSRVAVISHRLWHRQFDADPRVVGRVFHLNGEPITVVGVAPEGFTGTFIGFPFDVWLPLAAAPRVAPRLDLADRGGELLELVGFLDSSVALDAARSAVAGWEHLLAPRPDEPDRSLLLRPVNGLEDSLEGAVVSFVAVLGVVAGLLLLLAGVNVAGVLQARANERRRGLAVRSALGAGRGTLVRLQTVEAVLLFVVGGAGGLALGRLVARWLERLDPPFAVSLAFDFGLDARVVILALLLAGLAGVVFALVPALRATPKGGESAIDLTRGRDPAATAGGRGWGVAAQLALSTVLLSTAAILVHGLWRAAEIDPGFDLDRVVASELYLSLVGPDEEPGRIFYRRLTRELRALPGVESVSLGRRLPLTWGRSTAQVTVPDTGREIEVDGNLVEGGWFETLGIPMITGEPFGPAASEESDPVAVVDEALARRLWSQGDAVGRILVVDGIPRRVTGIAATAKVRRLWEEPTGHVYVPFEQRYAENMAVVVRTSGDPAPVSGEVRAVLRRLEPDLPDTPITTLRRHAAIALLPQRIAAAVAAGIGGLGLILAAVGVTAAVMLRVASRRREIGVRLALGAGHPRVVWWASRRGLIPGAVGIGIGLLAGLFFASRLPLFLVPAGGRDPRLLIGVSVLLALLTAGAAWLPARRAAGVDPMTVLREE